MNHRQRRILMFAIGFVPPFVVAVWLYPSIVPSYQGAIVAVVNRMLLLLSPASEIRTMPTGHWHIVIHRPLGGRLGTYALTSANVGFLAFFQQVVLSALILATPTKPTERLRLLACGIGVMFGLHACCVLGCAYGIAVIDDPKSLLFRSLPIILGPFASGLAVVVWSVLTWGYWLRLFDSPAVSPRGASVGRTLRAIVKPSRRSARVR